MVETARIEAAILRLTEARGADRSICPSEVARDLDSDWHRLMSAVRRAAIRLAAAGRIEILRKGQPVSATGSEIKGVIRLRARPGTGA